MNESRNMWCSVVMPVHHGERFLDDALASVAQQDERLLAKTEVIAIDDGSTDASREILEEWSERLTIRIVERKQPSSWVKATEAGLEKARGEWLSFLHQDDRWRPARLRTLSDAVRAYPEVDFFCHPSLFIDEQGRKLGEWTPPLDKDRPLSPSEVLPRYAIQNFLAIPAPFFRRNLLAKRTEMRVDLWFLADWALWVELIAESRAVCCLGGNLADFRLHRGAQTVARSSDAADLRRQFRAVRDILRPLLNADEDRKWLERAGSLNEDVTVCLSAWLHARPGALPRVVSGAFGLGPRNWPRFLRETCLRQRVGARIKLVRSTRTKAADKSRLDILDGSPN